MKSISFGCAIRAIISMVLFWAVFQLFIVSGIQAVQVFKAAFQLSVLKQRLMKKAKKHHCSFSGQLLSSTTAVGILVQNFKLACALACEVYPWQRCYYCCCCCCNRTERTTLLLSWNRTVACQHSGFAAAAVSVSSASVIWIVPEFPAQEKPRLNSLKWCLGGTLKIGGFDTRPLRKTHFPRQIF